MGDMIPYPNRKPNGGEKISQIHPCGKKIAHTCPVIEEFPVEEQGSRARWHFKSEL
jgi:hypothetical protein